MTMRWWSGEDPADRAAEYAAYLESLFPTLPGRIRELSRIPCHDASLTRLALSTPTRELLLEMELAGTTGNLRLRYEAVENFVSTGRADEGLPSPGGYGDLGYDEIDIGADRTFVHRLLFSNGIEFEITFRDVRIENYVASVETI